MLRKPKGYDEAPAYTGEYMSLPAGLYVCKVRQVSETQTRNGDEQVAVLFDIAEGEYKDFYSKQYEAARASGDNAKWKGVYRQGVAGKSLPFYKGLITSIEKSNPGFTFLWDREGNEKTLVGKKFGAVMGREQFPAQDGTLRFATKIFQVRSVEGLKDAKVPEDRLLPQGQSAGCPDPVDAAMQHGTPVGYGFMNIPDGIDEELPFL